MSLKSNKPQEIKNLIRKFKKKSINKEKKYVRSHFMKFGLIIIYYSNTKQISNHAYNTNNIHQFLILSHAILINMYFYSIIHYIKKY